MLYFEDIKNINQANSSSYNNNLFANVFSAFNNNGNNYNGYSNNYV